jgi:polyferredoxin
MMNDKVVMLCILSTLTIWFVIVGNIFCGKICPVGYAQDLIFKIPFFVKIKTFKFDKNLRLLKYISVMINFLLLPILASFGIYQAVQNNREAEPPIIGIIIILVILMIITVIIRRPYCKYLCPIGAVSSLFNKVSFYKYKILNDECIKCGACSKVCKMNIVPYQMNNSLECIRCGLCKKICPRNAIVSGFNAKKL